MFMFILWNKYNFGKFLNVQRSLWHHRLNGYEFEQALGVGDG